MVEMGCLVARSEIAVIHDESGARPAAVYFVGELCLGEEVIEGGVVWEGARGFV